MIPTAIILRSRYLFSYAGKLAETDALTETIARAKLSLHDGWILEFGPEFVRRER